MGQAASILLRPFVVPSLGGCVEVSSVRVFDIVVAVLLPLRRGVTSIDVLAKLTIEFVIRVVSRMSCGGESSTTSC